MYAAPFFAKEPAMINRFCKKPLLECSFQPASLCGGATRRTPSCCPHPTCFNPRAREGSTATGARGARTREVSTREPVRARLRACRASGQAGCFNPRAREGSTTGEGGARRRLGVSTREPVRARLYSSVEGKEIRCRFNPRAREGSTKLKPEIYGTAKFQPASP